MGEHRRENTLHWTACSFSPFIWAHGIINFLLFFLQLLCISCHTEPFWGSSVANMQRQRENGGIQVSECILCRNREEFLLQWFICTKWKASAQLIKRHASWMCHGCCGYTCYGLLCVPQLKILKKRQLCNPKWNYCSSTALKEKGEVFAHKQFIVLRKGGILEYF